MSDTDKTAGAPEEPAAELSTDDLENVSGGAIDSYMKPTSQSTTTLSHPKQDWIEIDSFSFGESNP